MAKVMRIKGIQTTKSYLRKLDKKINKPIKKKLLTEVASKTKGFAHRTIASNASASGNLLKGTHYRVMENQARIWNDFIENGIYGNVWENGMTPHFIHRNMISEAGYTVGDWMDSKGFNPNRQYVLVGAGTPIGRGIQFMAGARAKIIKKMPMILNKYAKMMR